jgi:hypothetical protein
MVASNGVARQKLFLSDVPKRGLPLVPEVLGFVIVHVNNALAVENMTGRLEDVGYARW